MPFRALLLCAALCSALWACSPTPAAPPVEKAPASALHLDTVTAGARLTSPARITGVAPNSWYFEAVFQAKLIGADGKVIAEGPAQAQTDWTREGPVPFVAELTFDVPVDTRATLMLAEDMYGSEDHPESTKVARLPVVLAATKH